MLRNIFVVLGMVFCFCVSCDKEDNDVKAVENMRDWYKVEDKPGEVNHLLYKMYKYYDVTIFINDTLGYGVLRVRDLHGWANDVIR